MAQICPCSLKHSPPITEAELDQHHFPPKSWPMVDATARKVVTVCVCCHRRCHRLHNLYVHHGGKPLAGELRGFRPLELEIAAYAWDNADHSGPGHLPYTLDSGETPA